MKLWKVFMLGFGEWVYIKWVWKVLLLIFYKFAKSKVDILLTGGEFIKLSNCNLLAIVIPIFWNSQVCLVSFHFFI